MTAASGSPETARHIPVMLPDVLDALQPKPHETYIDGTFGAGGYTRAILETADCRVVAFDRDPTAIADGAPLVQAFAPRLTLLHRPFGEMAEAIQEIGVEAVDGVVLDIGVSSMQIDQAERGFSFQSDGPLDMRMSCEGPSAADVVNGFEEEQIADIIYEYGEERRSRAIARAIVKARAIAPLTRTKELADLVLRVFHGRKEDGRHPATRTFQGLRIFINNELGELERALSAAEKILRPGGRLVLVTFHSLEDRIVKRFLAERSGKMDQGSRYLPQKNIQVSPPSFRLVNSRPLTPQKGELDVNPRARSARLRAAIRTDAPAWSTAPGSG
ncbi:MAG: 16S rRNA (cytosine(1402)-N(4))-methyltransferase RsmH [Hyphomicrobium sp.]|nr:16S rRNA (cytosine(1402)-N(4))-methyltransferase RsmH [Hyphomicrobium sp.]